MIDYVIASASEDCLVKVWQLPEGGLPYDAKDPKKNKDLTVSDLLSYLNFFLSFFTFYSSFLSFFSRSPL